MLGLNGTITNLAATTFTSTNAAVTTSLTAASILATTSISSGLLNATNSTITNAAHTTFTSTNAAVTTSLTAASILATTSISSGLLNATNSTITNLAATTFTSTNAVITTSLTAPSILATNLSTGTLRLSSTQIALGSSAGATAQSTGAIAIGQLSGNTSQGGYSIAIGYNAGQTSQHAYSIILNATTGALNSGTSGTFYVNPIRNVTQGNLLGYDTTLKEVTYFSLSTGLTTTNLVATNISTNTLIITSGSLNATFNSNTVGSIVTTGGNIGIGTTSPAYQLQLSSDSAAKPSTNTWTVSSDERLKTNIQLADLDMCYSTIKSIPLKRYTWRDDVYSSEQVPDRSKLGWIAQDVEQVIPKAVEQRDMFGYPDCRTLNNDQIMASLYGTVQKLMGIVENLQDQINQNNTNNIGTLSLNPRMSLSRR